MWELVWEFVGHLLFYLFFLPVSFLLATPFILVGAFFGPEGYFSNVLEGYRKVYDFWRGILLGFLI